MVDKNWRRVVSGVGLILSGLYVVVHSMTRFDRTDQFYGVVAVALFGYLFLSYKDRHEERTSPWWW